MEHSKYMDDDDNDHYSDQDACMDVADWASDSDHVDAPIPQGPSAKGEDGSIRPAESQPEGAETDLDPIPPKFYGGPQPH